MNKVTNYLTRKYESLSKQAKEDFDFLAICLISLIFSLVLLTCGLKYIQSDTTGAIIFKSIYLYFFGGSALMAILGILFVSNNMLEELKSGEKYHVKPN